MTLRETDKEYRPLEPGDIISASGISCNAWRDGQEEYRWKDELRINDGDVWISDSKPPSDEQRLVQWDYVFTDEERVKTFERTGNLGPESELRKMEVRMTRKFDLGWPTHFQVFSVFPSKQKGIWEVKVFGLNPLTVCDNTTAVHFYLMERGVSCDELDEKKVVHEDNIKIHPNLSAVLFGGWCGACLPVSRPKLGHILSGRELRKYFSEVDRNADYFVVVEAKQRQEVVVCGVSSTPRDCRDTHCWVRHQQNKIMVDAGISIVLQKAIVDPEGSNRVALVDSPLINLFFATDRSFTSTTGNDKLYVGTDRTGNFIFTIRK